MNARILAAALALVALRTHTAIAQRPELPTQPAVTTTFQVGKFWREDREPVLGGVEITVGKGWLRPSVAVLFGQNAGAVELGLIASGRAVGRSDQYAGISISAYDIETYRVMSRLGWYVRAPSTFALVLEGRAYMAPIEPGLVLGIVIHPPR